MNVRQLVSTSLESADLISLGYIRDLSDDDLMRRPHPACNHLNWQFGHLVRAEHEMMGKVAPMPPLPPGFAERYDKATQASDRRGNFCNKDELLRAQSEQRRGTLEILNRLGDADLDRETGVDYAPTVGAILALIPAHWLMHAGQWVIVRRELGRPPIF